MSWHRLVLVHHHKKAKHEFIDLPILPRAFLHGFCYNIGIKSDNI